MIGQGTRWSCLCLACVWPVSVSGAAHASFSATQRGADGKEKHRSQGMRCSAECGTVPHMHFQYCTENDVAGRGEEGGDRASEERVASRQVERLLIITGLCSGAGRGPSPEDERQPGRRQDRYCTVLYCTGPPLIPICACASNSKPTMHARSCTVQHGTTIQHVILQYRT